MRPWLLTQAYKSALAHIVHIGVIFRFRLQHKFFLTADSQQAWDVLSRKCYFYYPFIWHVKKMILRFLY